MLKKKLVDGQAKQTEQHVQLAPFFQTTKTWLAAKSVEYKHK